MKCRDCPYIKEDFDRKTQDITDEYDLDEYEQSCWCDKTGGKVWWCGQCSDSIDDIPPQKNRSKQRKRSKRERDFKHKQKLKFLADNLQYYPSPAYYKDKEFVGWSNGGYVPIKKPYYKRQYRDNHKNGRYKWYKNYANRQVRRYNGELHSKGNCYRKVYDFWWEVD